MQRNIRLRLRPTAAQRAILLDTLAANAACFNAVTAYGWAHQERNGVALHRATYYPLRAAHPTLPAQLVCSSRVRAAEALKSALTRQRQGRKTGCPTSQRVPIRYDARSYRLLPTGHLASLATTAGRQQVPFSLYPYVTAMLAQATGVDSADLLFREGVFQLHVVLTLPDPPWLPSGAAVGIDLGLARPAVASNNRFFGPRCWRELEQRAFRLRRQLQAKGTPSAKRHLRRLGRKVARFRRDCDHVLSKRIVQSVTPGTVLVVENLTNIRARARQRGPIQRRRFHAWSFAQLRGFRAYKAEAHGCWVVGVDPRHTSQTCSRCGYQDRTNRRSQAVFRCRSCGFEMHADLNGARNIAAKYLAGLGNAGAGGPPVNWPIVSGLCVHGSAHKPSALADGR